MLFRKLKERPFQFVAIYFVMGQYNKDDKVPKRWVGLDCPFEDESLVLYARSEKELSDMIEAVLKGEDIGEEGVDWEGEYSADLEGVCPELICDPTGKLAVDMMKLVYGSDYNPKKDKYSNRRENILQFWKREKWRFL